MIKNGTEDELQSTMVQYIGSTGLLAIAPGIKLLLGAKTEE
jgi:hypothetical protein